MESKQGGFNAGAFFDDGMKEAGIDPEEVVDDSPVNDDTTNVVQVNDDKAESETKPAAETKPDEKAKPSAEDVAAALESTKETEQQVDSIISELIPKSQVPDAAQTKPDFEPGKYVPVEDHIKLRARAQAAEREAEDLRQRLETSTTQTGGVKPGTEVEKSPEEKYIEENSNTFDPETEPFPAKVQLEERKYHEAKAKKAQQAKEQAEQSEREKQEKQYRTNEAIKAIRTKAEQSEAEFRKANPDFEAVVRPFVKANMLTEAEKIESLKDANPAKMLYDICKAKAEALRGVIGVPNAPNAKPETKAPTNVEADAANEEGEEELTDDQIYDQVKGLFHKEKQ
jgi:hypothetical protein